MRLSAGFRLLWTTAMTIERKSYPIADLKVAEEQGVIEAIVSVFSNVDSGNEKVMPGFFAKSIERKLPKGVWAHDWKQPIAKTLEAKELLPGDPLLPDALKTLGGAYIKGQFNLDTQRGREAYSDIKFGIVDEFSIGYRVVKDGKDKESGARELIEGEWKEWSPVLVGMNDQTRLISIKTEDDHKQIKSLVAQHGHEAIIQIINSDLPEDDRYLKGESVSGSFESFDAVVSAVEKHTANMQRNHDNRTKEGRVLSGTNRAKVEAAYNALGDLLTASEPVPKEKSIDVLALRTQAERVRNNVLRDFQ